MAKSLILVAFTIVVVAMVATAAPDSNKRRTLRNQPSYIPISFGRRDTEGAKDSSSLSSSLNLQREIESRSKSFPITFGKRDDELKRIPGLFPSKRNSKSKQPLPITFGKRDGQSAKYPSITFGRRDISSVNADKRDSQSHNFPSISFGKRDTQLSLPAISFGRRDTQSSLPTISFGRRDTQSSLPTISFGRRDTQSSLPTISFGKRGTNQGIVPRSTRLSRQLYNYGPDMYMMPEEINYLAGMEEPMDFDYGLYYSQNTPGTNIFGKYTLPIWNLDSAGFVESDEIPIAVLKRNEERLAKDRSTRYDQKKKKKLFLGLPRFGDQDRSARSTLKDRIRSIKSRRDNNQPLPVIYEV